MKWNTKWNKGKHLGCCLEVFNWTFILHPQICIKFKEFAHLTLQCKTKLLETGYYCPSSQTCHCVMKLLILLPLLLRPSKAYMNYIYVKVPNVAQHNCLFLNREMYLAGCELHVQALLFLVLTWKQYVNTKTIWRSKVWSINCHDDYCQPLMTYAALIQPLEVFLGKRVVLEPSLHFTPGLQSSVCILLLVCLFSSSKVYKDLMTSKARWTSPLTKKALDANEL